jgi:tetratricopeptide (TPR) repeat protein
MAGEVAVMAPEPSARDNMDLLQTIAQLENRIRDLEHDDPGHAGNGHGERQEAAATIAPASAISEEPQSSSNGLDTDRNHTEPEGTDRIAVLLGKGQSLLNVEKAEEALSCFEEVLALDARNPEALVKKGAALERMRKLNEAIECYDRAIEADSTMTIAYLYKGGLCNRMERFNEALQCYEQALRTQEKRAA